jgi:prolipoprotein diacylglyceryltransferase
VIAWLLVRWRKAHVADTLVLGRYFVLAGLTRFAIEFVRVNLRVLGPFTVAHLISLSLAVAGVILLGRSRTARFGA